MAYIEIEYYEDMGTTGGICALTGEQGYGVMGCQVGDNPHKLDEILIEYMKAVEGFKTWTG